MNILNKETAEINRQSETISIQHNDKPLIKLDENGNLLLWHLKNPIAKIN